MRSLKWALIEYDLFLSKNGRRQWQGKPYHMTPEVGIITIHLWVKEDLGLCKAGRDKEEFSSRDFG